MLRLMNLLKASPSNYQCEQRAAFVLPGERRTMQPERKGPHHPSADSRLSISPGKAEGGALHRPIDLRQAPSPLLASAASAASAAVRVSPLLL